MEMTTFLAVCEGRLDEGTTVQLKQSPHFRCLTGKRDGRNCVVTQQKGDLYGTAYANRSHEVSVRGGKR